MGSAAGEGRQGWQQLGTFGQVSQYIYKIQKMIKKSEIQKGLVGWWAWLLLHSQWLLLNSQGLLVLLGSMLPEKIINAYVTKNITSMYYIQILFHGFVMQKNLFPGWLGEDLVRHGERSSGLHGEQVDCPAPGFLSRTLIAKYWNTLTPSMLAFDPVMFTSDIKYWKLRIFFSNIRYVMWWHLISYIVPVLQISLVVRLWTSSQPAGNHHTSSKEFFYCPLILPSNTSATVFVKLSTKTMLSNLRCRPSWIDLLAS